jgi:tetratricopeptide (TPR) repeat protein
MNADLTFSDLRSSALICGQKLSLRYTVRVQEQGQAKAQLATRPVLRIFISSTAVDLLEYREKVRDAVLSLKELPVAMETFSATSGQPASECMKMAAEADAVICIVAHRYGYVPPKELGGDGERSITWLEVDAARNAGKPVFAFVIDPQAPWTAVKEQDRLTTEPPEKTTDIIKAVQDLQKFKGFLQSEYMRGKFTNKDELATQAAIAVANFAKETGAPVSIARRWQPLVCYALQPAQHFRGRRGLLQQIKDWLEAPVTPDRVVSLVAAGGTGKTALVNKALYEARLSDRAGIFVWSFYEDPRTDEFLRRAYVYFTGREDAAAGGMLEKLQMALSGDLPHILILDGLERVQSEGDHRRRGGLEDIQLKRLMRGLAGGIGNARALVTSRFPLVDLEDWKGVGHRSIMLDDLERAAALDVLRARNVKGDDTALTQLLEPLNANGYYHALSVDVLGSYLGNFHDGDPSYAPEFSIDDAKEADPKARRLGRILEKYVTALTPRERDLLARLSLFPRGIQIEFLGWLVQAGGEIAGSLIGCNNKYLALHLERLKELGLVFRYETEQPAAYSAHPFLRDFFRNLLGTKPESIHESVRARLAPSLQERPDAKPSDPRILDQYELLIEETLLSGRIQKAYDLHTFGLGGYRNLAHVLGEHGRGLRILEGFVPEDEFQRVEHCLDLDRRGDLLMEFGLYAADLGDLTRARRALAHALRVRVTGTDRKSPRVARNLVDCELKAGLFPQALASSKKTLSLVYDVNLGYVYEFSLYDVHEKMRAHAYRATSHFALGHIIEADAGFQTAENQGADIEKNSVPLDSISSILQCDCRLLRGQRVYAISQTRDNKRLAISNQSNYGLSLCNSLLARLLLQDDTSEASKCLQDARSFAKRSGVVDLQLRCFHAACELYRHLGDYPQAIAEAEAGILLADTCGFGKYSIDIRLALAETLLAAGDARKALQNARAALDRSEHPDCQYAWGKADGLHFCGLAHLRLGERELARQRLTAALEIRERLGHGRIEETRKALAGL